jgi:hypothetical protein
VQPSVFLLDPTVVDRQVTDDPQDNYIGSARFSVCFMMYPMISYVDESIRAGERGLYVVGVVLVDPGDADAMRRRARAVLLRRQRRFHWHEEGAEQRRRMLGLIAGSGVAPRAYVCQPVPLRREERARALCLNALLWDLWQHLGVARLVLERRQASGDRRDSRTIQAAKAAKRADPALRWSFVRPDDEPLLWLADAVASAMSSVAAGAAGGEGYRALLGPGLTEIDVDP